MNQHRKNTRLCPKVVQTSSMQGHGCLWLRVPLGFSVFGNDGDIAVPWSIHSMRPGQSAFDKMQSYLWLHSTLWCLRMGTFQIVVCAASTLNDWSLQVVCLNVSVD